MGNSVGLPCIQRSPAGGAASFVKLIFWEGSTRVLRGSRHIAGDIMFEFPEKMVCHADSFFIGKPIAALGVNDELMSGHTYFVLPVEPFACTLLSASTLGDWIRSIPSKSLVKFGECPFQYFKGSDGRVLIKVMPEFIIALIKRGKESTAGSPGSPGKSFLCNTPELQKHYQQLVGSKEHAWSPKLETISEYKIRVSPCRFIRLEWTVKE